MITVGDPDRAALLHIASNLRDADRQEIGPLLWEFTPEALAERAMSATNSLTRVWAYRGAPVAILGAVPLWPNVWSAWAFGTDEWPRVVLRMTRYARRFMLPAIYGSGAVRVQAISLAARADSEGWMRRCFGARVESTLHAYGAGGEDYRMLVLGRAELERNQRHVHRYQTQG